MLQIINKGSKTLTVGVIETIKTLKNLSCFSAGNIDLILVSSSMISN